MRARARRRKIRVIFSLRLSARSLFARLNFHDDSEKLRERGEAGLLRVNGWYVRVVSRSVVNSFVVTDYFFTFYQTVRSELTRAILLSQQELIGHVEVCDYCSLKSM